MRRVLFAIVLTIALAVPAHAGFDEGLAAHKRGDYATALREWRPLAEQGNATAQSYLGAMFHYGLGVAAGLCRGDEVVPQGRRAG